LRTTIGARQGQAIFAPSPAPITRTNATLAAAQRANKQQTNIKQSRTRLFDLM
jgi:hypothetical protein